MAVRTVQDPDQRMPNACPSPAKSRRYRERRACNAASQSRQRAVDRRRDAAIARRMLRHRREDGLP